MSDIKMKIRAEVDPTSISNIKKEIEGLSQNIKPLKIKTESKDLMKITRDMEKVKSTINSMNNTKIKVFDENSLHKSGAEFVKVAETAEKSMRQIENQYKKMGETSIQGKNWNATTKELDQFTVKVKESEGVVKKYKYTLAELENGQKVWINQSIKGSEDQQKNVQNLIKSKKDLLNVEKQLDNLQHKAGNLDKNSTEYKKVTQEVERLRDTQKEYMQDLDKLSKADLNKLKTEVKGVDTELNKALKQQKEMKKETIDSKKFAGDMQTVGRNLMALSAPVMAVGAASIKMQMDFESSFAGMRKTISGSEQDFAKLEKGVREMSKTFPQSASEIAAVGEIAGQLGVQKEHILDFTKVMIMLGDSTNLSSSEAADSLARFRNITQMSFDDMDRLGATIVDLGNNFATTESEIVNMGLLIAGTGHQVGMTEAQILALSTALSSVGIKAERGGSSISKLISMMALAVETGNKDLKNFAKGAGMSAKEFQKAFKKDAAGAVVAFIQGLADMQDKGVSVIKFLDDMEIKEVRLKDTILRATGASDVFTDALETGNRAWEENTALVDEANERYKTAESQLKMMKNRIVDAGIEIGGKLAPSIVAAVDVVVDLVDVFSKLSKPVQTGIFKIFAFTTVLGGLMSVGGRFVNGILDTIGFVGDLTKVLGGTAKVATETGSSINGTTKMIGLLGTKTGIVAAGIVAGLAITGAAVAKHVKETKKHKQEMDKLVKDLPEIRKKDNNDIKYMQDIQSEFEYLNSLVGENGDLSAMSADQQKRYLDIVKRLSEASPEIETFYNSQGQLVTDTKTKIEELIKAKKDEMKMDALKARSGMKDKFKEYNKEIEKTASNLEIARNKAKELEKVIKTGKEKDLSKPDPITGETPDKILNEKEINERKQQLRELKAEIRDTTSEVKKNIEELMPVVSSELYLLSDELDNFTPHVENFEKSFKKILEDDPIHGADKVQQGLMEIGNIFDEVNEKIGKGLKITKEDSREYIDRMTKAGMSTHDATKNIISMIAEVETGEGKIKLLSDAVNEFNKNSGQLSPETAKTLSKSFSGVKEDIKTIDSELIKNIGTTDKWAAAFLASQMEVSNGFAKMFEDNFVKGTKGLDLSNLIDTDNLLKQMSVLQEAGNKTVDEAKRQAEEKKKSIQYLYEDLGVITKEQAEEEIRITDEKLQKQLKDTRHAMEQRQEIITNSGRQIGEAVKASMDETQDVMRIWDEFDPEIKEFIAKQIGVDETHKDFKELFTDWLQQPEVKDFVATSSGLDYVMKNIDELGEDWNKLNPEEKTFVAKMLGYGLEDAQDFQEKWDKLDPTIKEFIAEAAGFENVDNANEETMAKWAEDPGVRMFIASQGGLDNVRFEQDKTDGQWKIRIGDRVYTSDEKGAKDARDEFNKTKKDWDKIPATNVKDFIINKITNIKERIFGPKPAEKWTGDSHFKGGLSFVGERGRELLIYPDESYDITGDTAELRNLPRGTRIYNNKDTEDILSGKKIPKFAKGNTKAKKKSSSSTKDDYKAPYDRYIKLDEAIDRVNNSLSLNNELMKDKAGTEHIRMIEKQISLYEKQRRNLKALNNEQRKERAELERYLKKQGFRFSGSGDNRTITNPKHIKGKSRNVEDSYKRFFELNNQIAKTTNEWYSYQNQIKDARKEIEEMNRALVQNVIESQKRNKLQDLERRQREAEKRLEEYYNSQIEPEIERYSSLIDEEEQAIKNIEEAEKLRKEMEEREERLKDIEDARTRLYYLENNLLGQMTKEQAKLVGLENEREEHLENQTRLQELQIKLENLRNEKNIQQLTKLKDGTWDFIHVADERAIDSTLKEIEDTQKRHNKNIEKTIENNLDNLQKLQESYDEWERQNNLSKDLEERKKRIEQYRQEIQDIEDHYNEIEKSTNKAFEIEKENIERHYLDIDRLTDKKMKELQKTYKNNWQQIYKVMDKELTSIEKRYGELIDALSQPVLMPNVGSTSFYTPTTIPGHTNGVKVTKDHLAVVHGSNNDPEWIFRDKQLQELLKSAVLSAVDVSIPEIRQPNTINNTKDTKQIFHIGKLEFPSVNNAEAIERALVGLPNVVEQHANRK